MLLELSSGHKLILVSVANIATKLWAIELSVSLKFTKGLPDNFTVSLKRWASMWELTEINTVLKNLVNFLQEVSSSLTVGAADIIVWSSVSLSLQIFLFHAYRFVSSSSISSC